LRGRKYAHDAWSGLDSQLIAQTEPAKQITREKGKHLMFHSIRPLATRFVCGEEDFKTFSIELAGHGSFMLGPHKE
jgi:hypothetical protein